MLEVVLKELHDAKMKLVQAINQQDTDMIKKYEDVVVSLEKSAESLKSQKNKKKPLPMTDQDQK